MNERREVVLIVGSFLWLLSSLLKANIQAGGGESFENRRWNWRFQDCDKGMERKLPLP